MQNGAEKSEKGEVDEIFRTQGTKFGNECG